MASSGVVARGTAKQRAQERDRDIRRHAMEPLKSALRQHRPPMTQMWLKHELEAQGMHIGKTTLNNWMNGYCRVPREFVRTVSIMAGSNPAAEVYKRVKGREDVLFQPEK